MFSRWPLTVRGTGAAVLAVLCLVLAQRFALAELLYLAVLLVLLVAGSIATLYLVRRTERVTRSFDPAVVPVGGEVVVGLRVEIRSALPAAQGQWQDALPAGVHGDATGVFPQTTSGVRVKGHDARLAYTATAERRGIRNIGPLSVVATDPFGLARRRRTIGRALPLTITPALVELGMLADRSGDLGGGMHTATDQLGQGADNLIPRHYVPGDSMRRIHWRASAHRDELMVRQEEQETTPEAVVVLDRTAAHWSVDATRAPGTDDRFEAAVSACLSVAALLVREGYTVAVLDGDGAALSDAIDAGDTTGIERLAIDLATVKARREGSLGGLVALFAGGATGPLAVVTGAIGEADAAALTPLVHHTSLPMLLAVTSTGPLDPSGPVPGALRHAAETGWRVAEVDAGADLAAAWNAVADRGARRAGV